MAEGICLAAYIGIVVLILNVALRLYKPRVLWVLGTLVLLSPMLGVLWIFVGSFIGDATGWFRIEDSIRMQ